MGFYDTPLRHYRRETIILRRYRVERDWCRVSGVWETFAARAAVFLALAVLAAPTHGITFLLLPIAIGFIRNRPMRGIVLWTILLGWTGIGWVVALVKACGNR